MLKSSLMHKLVFCTKRLSLDGCCLHYLEEHTIRVPPTSPHLTPSRGTIPGASEDSEEAHPIQFRSTCQIRTRSLNTSSSKSLLTKQGDQNHDKSDNILQGMKLQRARLWSLRTERPRKKAQPSSPQTALMGKREENCSKTVLKTAPENQTRRDD